MLVHSTQDFLVLNKYGVSVVHLGTQHKRVLIDSNNREVLLHSLESYNFLKVDPCNYLKFNCLNEDEQSIQVMQEYSAPDHSKSTDNEYSMIYKVQIKKITLR